LITLRCGVFDAFEDGPTFVQVRVKVHDIGMVLQLIRCKILGN